MSVPAFIPVDSDRSIASVGIKLIQQVVLDNAVEVYYVDGAIPIRILNGSPAQRQVTYDNLIAQLLIDSPAPTISTPSTGSPLTITFGASPYEIELVGTGFLLGGKFTVNSVDYAIGTYDNSTLIFSVFIDASVIPLGTYDIIFTNPDGKSATVTGGLVVSP